MTPQAIEIIVQGMFQPDAPLPTGPSGLHDTPEVLLAITVMEGAIADKDTHWLRDSEESHPYSARSLASLFGLDYDKFVDLCILAMVKGFRRRTHRRGHARIGE